MEKSGAVAPPGADREERKENDGERKGDFYAKLDQADPQIRARMSAKMIGWFKW